MRAGERGERIDIQQRVLLQNDVGQPLESWATVARVWASVRHPTGLSAIKANADTSLVQASMRILYRSNLNAGMRAVHGAAVYDIKAVLPFKRDHVDLVCEVINAQS